MRPVSGWKPRAGSSVVTLHWMAQPLTLILSWLKPRSGRLWPSQTFSWACTRSTLEGEEKGGWGGYRTAGRVVYRRGY